MSFAKVISNIKLFIILIFIEDRFGKKRNFSVKQKADNNIQWWNEKADDRTIVMSKLKGKKIGDGNNFVGPQRENKV